MNKPIYFLLFIFFISFLLTNNLSAQIWPPEGLNMPGSWNGWQNPPTIPAIAGIQNPAGKLLLDTSLVTRRYSTIIYVASGGDIPAGTYQWLFTSGPPGNYFANKWAGVLVLMNQLQSYSFNTGSDNSVTLSNNTYYTVNWLDIGYANTKAIWMPTSANPVNLVSVTQSPPPGSVLPNQAVTVTVQTSNVKSPEEIIYIRYTTNNWASSNLVEVNFTGTNGEAIIPGQSGGTTVKYYAFSTTVPNPVTDFDMYTIKHNNNNKAYYSYSVLSPTYTIVATAGSHGNISPSGNVIVNHGDNITFTITPDPGYYIKDVLVDGSSVGAVPSYTFTNVTANHTIHATFAYDVNITFQVNMKVQMKMGRFKPELGDVVTVRGSFNDWGNSTNNPDTLRDLDNDSIYTKTIPIQAEQTIYYKFWKTPRGGLAWEDGISDRQFIIGTSDEVIPVVYFNNEEVEPVMVTFNVNMKVQLKKGKFQPEDGDIVAVRGSFNMWSMNDTLTDPDNDSIYTKVVPVPKNQTIMYKYWKTFRAGVDWENFWGDRSIIIGENDTIAPLVYFSNEFPDVNVTFQLNMKIKMIERTFLPEEGDIVTVRGSFNDWGNSTNNPDTLLDVDGDSIYIKTIPIPGNQTIYYKFWKTERAGQSWESDPDRSYLIELDDVILPIEYFDRDEVIDAQSFAVSQGWNMISVPVVATDFRKTSLFPSAVSNAFIFENGYTVKDTLENGKGYWLKFSSAQNISIIGASLQTYSIDVKAGWNMIGSISSPVYVGSITEIPENNTISFYYGYNNGYQKADTIFPGKSYWIKLQNDGQIVLNSAMKVLKYDKIEKFENELIIRDAKGNEQTLYFGKLNDQMRKMYELPPLPPAGIFDVRYSTGTIYAVEPENLLKITSAEYPLTIIWKSNTRARLVVDNKEIQVDGQGSTIITNPEAKIIFKTEGLTTPEYYLLEQNYPNPFNPHTTIKFQIPKDDIVTLKIFNILGQEVTTLINEKRSAGYYDIKWNATNVPSGVYFYKLTAGNFTSIKKMLLVK